MSKQLNLAIECPRIEAPDPIDTSLLPGWFRTSGRTKMQIHNVVKGLHPTGSPMRTLPGATCGDCAMMLNAKPRRCLAFPKTTHGKTTHVLKTWPACASFVGGGEE